MFDTLLYILAWDGNSIIFARRLNHILSRCHLLRPHRTWLFFLPQENLSDSKYKTRYLFPVDQSPQFLCWSQKPLCLVGRRGQVRPRYPLCSVGGKWGGSGWRRGPPAFPRESAEIRVEVGFRSSLCWWQKAHKLRGWEEACHSLLP